MHEALWSWLRTGLGRFCGGAKWTYQTAIIYFKVLLRDSPQDCSKVDANGVPLPISPERSAGGVQITVSSAKNPDVKYPVIRNGNNDFAAGATGEVIAIAKMENYVAGTARLTTVAGESRKVALCIYKPVNPDEIHLGAPPQAPLNLAAEADRQLFFQAKPDSSFDGLRVT